MCRWNHKTNIQKTCMPTWHALLEQFNSSLRPHTIAFSFKLLAEANVHLSSSPMNTNQSRLASLQCAVLCVSSFSSWHLPYWMWFKRFQCMRASVIWSYGECYIFHSTIIVITQSAMHLLRSCSCNWLRLSDHFTF